MKPSVPPTRQACWLGWLALLVLVEDEAMAGFNNLWRRRECKDEQQKRATARNWFGDIRLATGGMWHIPICNYANPADYYTFASNAHVSPTCCYTSSTNAHVSPAH